MKPTTALYLALLITLPIQALVGDQATGPEKTAADAALLLADHDPARATYLQRHLPFGASAPASANAEMLLVQEDYVTRYDPRVCVPRWVSYRMSAASLQQGADVYSSRIEAFRPDPRLAASQAVTHAEYTNSGFSRGHLAPNADFILGLNAMLNTYVMTNMCPQYQSFNGGIWSEFESRVRQWVTSRGQLYVTTGAIFDVNGDGRRDALTACRRTGKQNRIGVPTHFYKIILAETGNGWDGLAVILPHWQKRPSNVTVEAAFTAGVRKIDQVETAAGYNFFPGLPDDQERALESHLSTMWH